MVVCGGKPGVPVISKSKRKMVTVVLLGDKKGMRLRDHMARCIWLSACFCVVFNKVRMRFGE